MGNTTHPVMDEELATGGNTRDPHLEEGPPRSATHFLRDMMRDLGGTAPGGETLKPATASFGDVVERLDERAFGLMLLLLALPCCLPFIYLLPQLVALPMLALCGQLAAGRHGPWLPKKLRERRFEVAHFTSVLDKADRYIKFFERFARPRFSFLTDGVGGRVVGAILLVPTASILVPLPSTNTVPGIGVAIASVGLVERDGLLVILGLAVGLLWVGLLAFFGLEAASLIKDWISARL